MGHHNSDRDQRQQKQRDPRLRLRQAGSGKTKKHVTFMKPSDNKVKLVVPPSPAEKGKFWFQETETQVVKPIIFTVIRGDKVTISVDTALMITAIVAEESTKPQKEKRKQQQQSSTGTTTSLEVCRNPAGELMDHLDERLQNVLGNKSQVLARRKGEQWFTTATTVEVGSIVRTHVVMPAGAYLLRCNGPHDLHVFAQAEDIELKLE